MKTIVINEFFISNVFFPFLMVCLILGLVSFGLTIVHYFVCRFDEIREKEESINEVFLSVKNIYKKELVVIEEFVNEMYKFRDMFGEYEEKMLQQIYDDRFRNLKKLEKIDDKGKKSGSIRSMIEMENIIKYSIQQILSIGSKFPDIKSFSKYLNIYSEFKSLDDKASTNKSVYNRKVKEFNLFIINIPYLIFAILFKIEPRQLF